MKETSSRLLETNTKLLVALKISIKDSSASSLEISVESETENTGAATRIEEKAAEMQNPYLELFITQSKTCHWKIV